MYTAKVAPADLKRRVRQLNEWLELDGLAERLYYAPVEGGHTVGWHYADTHSEATLLWAGSAKECLAAAEIVYRRWYMTAGI